jgi:hypothetical protein
MEVNKTCKQKGTDLFLQRSYAYISASPLSKIDLLGLLEWSGGYVSGGAGLGLGLALDYYDLKTKCINGKRGRVRFIGVGGQGSIGPLPVSLSAGSVTFEDGLSEVDPEVFEGLYMKVSAEYGLGFGVS